MYVETKVASIVFNVKKNTLIQSIKRNSKKYTYRYIQGVGRGGRKLIVQVEETELSVCVERGDVSNDIILYDVLPDGEIGEMRWCDIYTEASMRKAPRKAPDKTAAKESLSSENDRYFVLDEDQKERANARLKILKDYEAAKSSGMRVSDFVTYHNSCNPDCELNEQKLYRWQRNYKKSGITGLADQRGKGRKGVTKLSDWQQGFVLEQFRAFGAGGINFAQLWDSLHEEAGRRGEIDYAKFLRGEVKPLHDYGTVKRFVNNYYADKPLEYTMITLGEDKAKSYFQPAMGNQKENVLHRNQCWQIDSSPADVMVRDGENGEAFRPNILSIVDVYSGRSVMSLEKSSNALSLVRLLWKAFEKMGKPLYIKGDNGKDYLSRQFQELLNGLGINYDRAIAYAGDEKGYVERHFRTVQHGGISFIPGYIGNNLAKREMIEQRTPKRNRKAKDQHGHVKKTNQEHLITFEQLKMKLDTEVTKWELMTVRRKNKAPIDIWNADDTPIQKVSFEEFILYAGGATVRTVSKKGIAYEALCYVGDAMPPVGTKVVVRENIDNKQEVFVYDLGGKFLCRAYDKEIAPMSAEEYKACKREFRGTMSDMRKLIKSAEYSAFTRLNIELDHQRMKELYRATLRPENFDPRENDAAKQIHKQINEQRTVDAMKAKVFDIDTMNVTIPSNKKPTKKVVGWDDMALNSVKFKS